MASNMQCEIRAMAEAAKPQDRGEAQLPRPGQVTEVCREWLVHEDGALAYRLQSEEIQEHYTGNKFRNALVRQDIPCAKEEQKREEQEAAELQAMYDRILQEQEEHDAQVAQQLAEELEREEYLGKLAREQKDEEIAKEMMKREREKVAKRRAQRELKEVEREARNLGHLETSHSASQLVGQYEDTLAQALRQTYVEDSGPLLGASLPIQDVPSGHESSLGDLSDFCIKPAPGMDDWEVKRLQEEQDAELARLLQEQESKRRGDVLQRDRLMAMEAQDRELAKVLQEQERAKARRAKERARQKRQHQYEALPQAQGGGEEEYGEGELPTPPELPEGYEEEHIPQRPTHLDLRVGTGRGARKSHCLPDPEAIEELPTPESSTPGAMPNIAMAIDPTYSRRSHPKTPVATFSPSEEEIEPASCISSPAYSLPPPDLDDDSPVPPYMPIQGQRRLATPERKPKKTKPKKESRDGCKTQ